MRSFILFFVLIFVLTACTSVAPTRPTDVPTGANTTAPTIRFRPADWSALPDWPSERLADSWQAWLQSCKRLANKPVWRELCRDAATVASADQAAIQRFMEKNLQPWRIESNTAETGLITGYYEPLLRGTRQRKPGYFPIYAPPDDLLTIELADVYPELKGMRLRGRLSGTKVLPYWNRAEIEQGKAPMLGHELVWVDDEIELFFLQIQGSGRVKLEDGSVVRIGYADQNGHPYKSIGKWLIDQGELKPEQASMQGIQAWARANPARLSTMLNSNPSYVFFRTLPNTEGGPLGALNVPLTDGASVAIDPKFIPLGSPLYLATTWPNDSKPLNRVVQAQDTGGAIRGPIRADFFWGFGAEAGQRAGAMKQQGRLWLLWPKQLALPDAAVNK